MLASIPERNRLLVTSHDAFAYFGRRYGLDVTAIQGISTAAEATTADVERVAGLLAARRVPAVFVETSVPHQTIDALVAAAAQRGATVQVGGELFTDAGGSAGHAGGDVPRDGAGRRAADRGAPLGGTARPVSARGTRAGGARR